MACLRTNPDHTQTQHAVAVIELRAAARRPLAVVLCVLRPWRLLCQSLRLMRVGERCIQISEGLTFHDAFRPIDPHTTHLYYPNPNPTQAGVRGERRQTGPDLFLLRRIARSIRSEVQPAGGGLLPDPSTDPHPFTPRSQDDHLVQRHHPRRHAARSRTGGCVVSP